jgi:hypothetical protein
MTHSLVFGDSVITAKIMKESDSLFVLFYNILLHKTHETNIHYKTLGVPGTITEVFNVLTDCLDKKEGYASFKVMPNDTRLSVVFNTKIGGVLPVEFILQLEETVVDIKLETTKKMEMDISKDHLVNDPIDTDYQDELFEEFSEWDNRLLTMSESAKRIVQDNRNNVLSSYQSAKYTNDELFERGNVFAGREYIFENQKRDAENICNIFYKTSKRVVSIIKRTKVGMDGLMIELATKMTTHPHDGFALHRDNIFFITGMSNLAWEKDMKEKVPNCFKENVYHHGKLKRLAPKIKNIVNALIIIDEIDSGDKEDQKLHKTMHESGILDIEYMVTHNIRLVFVSATMKKELVELTKWGNTHETYRMEIPENYIGHGDLMDKGVIREYYPIKDEETATKWIQEDILNNYGSDYRIHLIRTTEVHVSDIRNACVRNNICFRNHTSSDRISHEVLTDLFDNITNHFVIAIKGFYRRANLIPNKWKMKIGATHELCGIDYDTSVQIQGLPGRMCGYWRNILDEGHKTGPHRTSTRAIDEYEEWYINPYSGSRYNTTSSITTFLHPKYISNLNYTSETSVQKNSRVPIIIDGLSCAYLIFNTSKRVEKELFITNYLRRNVIYQNLVQFITTSSVKAYQITKPTSDGSYERHITNAVRKAERNEKFSIDITKENKNQNHWQCFIDNRNYRLCFIIWCIDDLYKDTCTDIVV